MNADTVYRCAAEATAPRGNTNVQRLLNLGCGSRYRVDLGWTNVDFKGVPGAVVEHNLAGGIPFRDQTFDVVYHSHLLEHLTRNDAERLMRECVRVLKSGGVCRVAVPNMEDICRQYLVALENALQGKAQAEGRYQWMLMELCDQLVRHYTGGEMADYLRQPDVPERDFIISRIGNIAKSAFANASGRQSSVSANCPSRWRRGRRVARRAVDAFRRNWRRLLLTRNERKALDVGWFRLRGEPHLWMYDRYSLRALLCSVGLESVEACPPTASRIAGWGRYYLDVDPDGIEHAPDSLYMEGVRCR